MSKIKKFRLVSKRIGILFVALLCVCGVLSGCSSSATSQQTTINYLRVYPQMDDRLTAYAQEESLREYRGTDNGMDVFEGDKEGFFIRVVKAPDKETAKAMYEKNYNETLKKVDFANNVGEINGTMMAIFEDLLPQAKSFAQYDSYYIEVTYDRQMWPDSLEKMFQMICGATTH